MTENEYNRIFDDFSLHGLDQPLHHVSQKTGIAEEYVYFAFVKYVLDYTDFRDQLKVKHEPTAPPVVKAEAPESCAAPIAKPEVTFCVAR